MSDATSYRNHHYVPQWYQRRFLSPGTEQLHYLSLRPSSVVNADGKRRQLPSLRRIPIKQAFAERDLYAVSFGSTLSPHLERSFFGDVDDKGAEAVRWWSEFDFTKVNDAALSDLLRYMSVQKLRTPKGLSWLRETLGVVNRNRLLSALTQLETLFSSIWAESVWQIAGCEGSNTKFLLSDHPVTVYNRECGPRHESCRTFNDPDIRCHGSHTIFPLSMERILILTNRSWVTNPYQSSRAFRPNPDYYRSTFFNFFDVQRGRELDEREVLEINFILKHRALSFIAASEKEWLFPERFVEKSEWANFGSGYLLMPDPRDVTAGGGVSMMFEGGHVDAYDMFGRRPWEPGYDGDKISSDWSSLTTFRREFENLVGPSRRGGGWESERTTGN